MNLQALIGQRDALRAQMRAILDRSEREGRDLTNEEMARFDALKPRADSLNRRIARLTEVHAIGTASRGAPRSQFASLGEFMHAVRFRPSDQRLAWVEAAGLRGELRMDDGASGGFAIPPQFVSTIRTITPQDAMIRPRAQVIPAGSPPDAPITIPALDQSGAAPTNMYGGVRVQWMGEGDTKPETDLKLREITLTPHEVAGTLTVTDKLLRNWESASPILEQQLRGAVMQAEEIAFLRGDGVGKPLGFLRSGACYRVPRAVANAVTYDDVVSMVVRLYGPGIFGYSRSMLGALMRLRDSQGRPLWMPSVAEGQPATLMGYPAVEYDRNPQLGQRGDLWLANFGQYLIKDGSGPFVAASEHVLFRQNKTVIKVFWNVDAAPAVSAPFAVNNGDIVSPFVALDVPSA